MGFCGLPGKFYGLGLGQFDINGENCGGGVAVSDDSVVLVRVEPDKKCGGAR